jgi:hypothetical protein
MGFFRKKNNNYKKTVILQKTENNHQNLIESITWMVNIENIFI